MFQQGAKAKKYNFEDRNAFLFCYVMIGIPLFFFIVFWLYINLDSILLAFQDERGAFTLRNFGDVIQGFITEDRYHNNHGQVLGRTVLLWFSVDIFCVLPSMFSSYVLYKKIACASLFRVIFMIPTILAGIVWTLVMKMLVSNDGPVVDILMGMGVNLPIEAQTQGLIACKETSYWTILALNMFPKVIGFNIIITGAYVRIPEELFEVGKLEGLNFVKEFFRIAVPLIWPTIVVSMITNLATVFTFDGNVFLYTNGESGPESTTMGYCIYKMTYDISFDTGMPKYGYPAAVGVTLTMITIPVVLFGKYVLEKAVDTVEY